MQRVHLKVIDDREPFPVASAAAAPRTFRRPRGRMGLAEARHIAGTLGKPSKMPGWSYGLDAFLCDRGSELVNVPGSTCYPCYARTAYYATWKMAVLARARRQAGLFHPDWLEAMVRQIEHYCVKPDHYFRWHDSGDLQDVLDPDPPDYLTQTPAALGRKHREAVTRNQRRTAEERARGKAEHLRRIAAICRRTPDVKHWLPTKEYEAVELFLAADAVPANLCIRLSAYMIDTEPVVLRSIAHLPTSTVHTAIAAIMDGPGTVECRAIRRGNKCGGCRACWNPRVTNVSYPQH